MEPIHLLLGSSGVLTTVFQHNDGNLFSGSESGDVIWWHIKSHRPLFQWKAHEKCVLNINFITSLNLLVTQGRDNHIQFWKLNTVTFSVEKGLSSLVTNALTFCRMFVWDGGPSSNCLVHLSSEDENSLEIVQFPSNTIQYLLKPNSDVPLGMCMALCGWSSSVLAGYESGHVALFNLTPAPGKQVCSSKLTQGSLMCMSYRVDKNQGVVGTADLDHILIFSVNESNLSVLSTITIVTPGVSCISWRKDGRLFATGGWDGRVRIFETKKHRQLAVLDWSGVADVAAGDACAVSKSKSVNCVLFSPDNLLISAGADKCICIWDVYSQS